MKYSLIIITILLLSVAANAEFELTVSKVCTFLPLNHARPNQEAQVAGYKDYHDYCSDIEGLFFGQKDTYGKKNNVSQSASNPFISFRHKGVLTGDHTPSNQIMQYTNNMGTGIKNGKIFSATIKLVEKHELENSINTLNETYKSEIESLKAEIDDLKDLNTQILTALNNVKTGDK